jgi:hypothetical protein
LLSLLIRLPYLMKTKSYHINNLGAFAVTSIADSMGYVKYHDSTRYKSASESQLDDWSISRLSAVRNAAITEYAERALNKWQENS